VPVAERLHFRQPKRESSQSPAMQPRRVLETESQGRLGTEREGTAAADGDGRAGDIDIKRSRWRPEQKRNRDQTVFCLLNPRLSLAVTVPFASDTRPPLMLLMNAEGRCP